MALSEIDRDLLQRCLERQPGSWEQFVVRFIGLVVHVINHTAQSRSIRLAEQDVEDLVADVFLSWIQDDFAILRRFRGEASLAFYLAVIARRVAVRELLKRKATSGLLDSLEGAAGAVGALARGGSPAEERISDREEVERLIQRLDGPERGVVRLYHLEGKSYHEISSKIGMPENSVGPTLSRAREKMRRAGVDRR